MQNAKLRPLGQNAWCIYSGRSTGKIPLKDFAESTPRLDGALCRAARALLGMSQIELCSAAGCGRKLLNDFENGTLVPKPTKIASLRSALEENGAVFVRIDDMLTVGVRVGQGSTRSARARSFVQLPPDAEE